MGRDPLRLPARRVRARDEGLLPDVRARLGALGRADPQADRPLAGAAADRLRRPLPVPSLRRRRPDRGDDGGADRGRRRPARRATSASASGRPSRSAAGARGRGRDEVRLLPAPVLDALARARGRGLPALRRERHLADRLVAAGAGRADRQVRAGQPPPEDSRAASDEMGSFVDAPLHARRDARGRPAAPADRRRGGADDGPARPRLGACAATSSPARSSARAAPSRSSRTSRLGGRALGDVSTRSTRRWATSR